MQLFRHKAGPNISSKRIFASTNYKILSIATGKTSITKKVRASSSFVAGNI